VVPAGTTPVGTLMATTLFPHLNAAKIAIWLSIVLVADLAATGGTLRLTRTRRGVAAHVADCRDGGADGGITQQDTGGGIP
jgi:hypothetical protein